MIAERIRIVQPRVDNRRRVDVLANRRSKFPPFVAIAR